MSINIDTAYYNVEVSNQSDGKVRLGLVGDGKTYSTQLTRQDAKRLAYALLLAADGVTP